MSVARAGSTPPSGGPHSREIPMSRDALARPRPGLARAVAACSAAVVALVALVVLAAPSRAAAQGFGQNKVNYETFNFKTIQTPHFDILYYPAESLATAD